jgi:hypothetical protein
VKRAKKCCCGYCLASLEDAEFPLLLAAAAATSVGFCWLLWLVQPTLEKTEQSRTNDERTTSHSSRLADLLRRLTWPWTSTNDNIELFLRSGFYGSPFVSSLFCCSFSFHLADFRWFLLFLVLLSGHFFWAPFLFFETFWTDKFHKETLRYNNGHTINQPSFCSHTFFAFCFVTVIFFFFYFGCSRDDAVNLHLRYVACSTTLDKGGGRGNKIWAVVAVVVQIWFNDEAHFFVVA